MLNQLYADLVFYPTLGWNILLGRILNVRNWWDAVDDSVILGAYPFKRDVPNLAAEGVGAVVNTCHEYQGPIDQYQKSGISQLHIPTTDFTHPKLTDVEKAVDFIQAEIAKGHRVYVHCKAGRARSATVVACWLIKYKNQTAAQAQATMLAARPHVNPRIGQREVVRTFEQKHLNR